MVPLVFEGIAVFLTSEVHAVQSESGGLAPVQLIEALATIVGYQSEIIEAHGGKVEQYVGDCVVAYWMPDQVPMMFGRVRHSIRQMFERKVKVPTLSYHLRVNFSIAELAGAVVGSKTAFRFQLVGKARSRAGALPRLGLRTDYALTDAETVNILSEEARTEFEPITSTAYRLRV